MVFSISFLSGFDAALDGFLVAGAFDDRGVVLVDADLLGLAELGELDVFELDAQFFEDGGAAGDDGDVFQHRLAAIAEAGGLDGGDLEGAAELVDDQGRQGFAFDVLGDDEQGLPSSAILLRTGTRSRARADFLLVDQDVGVFEDGFHACRIGDEMRARDNPCRTACLRRVRRWCRGSCLLRR